MRPIPKKLLIHTASQSRRTDIDRWGAAEIAQIAELQFVRLEPSKQVTRDKNNAEIQLAATLFFDCKNSKPADIEFKVDDLILFNGEKYQIKVIEPLYDEHRLHHYELGLIKSV